MATQPYRNWLAAGEPYQLAEWMNDFVKTMRGHGYTVYHYPDIAHLTTDQPQDHAPFSFTGWPIDSPFGWGFGVDIMPKNGDARSLTPLARQIIADKDAGHPALAGLKYINWTDEQGKVWQTSWKPAKATRPNTDKGHIHLSGRSDSAKWRAVGYDPIARINGGGSVTPEEIRTIVRQVFLSLTHESTDEGYIEANQNGDTLNDSIRQGSASTLVDVMREMRASRALIEQLIITVNAGGGNVDTAALSAKIDNLQGQIIAAPAATVAALAAELTN